MRIFAATFGVAAAFASGVARAEHLDQKTQEIRTILYFNVSDARLAPLLPAGWQPMRLENGPAKGANLTINISDQLWAAGANGAPAGDERGRAMTISARVCDPETGENRAMVLFGMTDGHDAPGPYGLHHKAKVDFMGAENAVGTDAVQIENAWNAADLEGDRLKVTLAFARGPLNATHAEQQTRSSAHPGFFRIYKADSLTDVVRSAAGKTDRVSKFEMSLAGAPAKYLDASQSPVAIVSLPAYRREIWLPD